MNDNEPLSENEIAIMLLLNAHRINRVLKEIAKILGA